MQYQRALKTIVAALEQNLQLLDAHWQVGSGVDIGAIARRRRRALSTLRAALRQRGIPVSPAASGSHSAPLPPSLNDLRQDEFRLLGLYDAGLGLTGEGAAEARLLTAQRAEAEQAYLTFAAALRDGRLASPAATAQKLG